MAKATPCEIRLSPPVTSLCGDSSSHNKLSASVKHGTTYFRRISCAEQAAVGVRPHCSALFFLVPIIGTFLEFWVPIYISGSLFSVFWLHSREECQFSLHVYNNELF